MLCGTGFPYSWGHNPGALDEVPLVGPVLVMAPLGGLVLPLGGLGMPLGGLRVQPHKHDNVRAYFARGLYLTFSLGIPISCRLVDLLLPGG